MPHAHAPVPEEEMAEVSLLEDQHFAGQRTICQTLREIWQATSDEATRLKIRKAMAMAKAMHLKLTYYKDKEQNA